MAPGKAQRAGSELRSAPCDRPGQPRRPFVADRRKAVPAQRRQAGAALPGHRGAGHALAPAHVEVQPVADHETPAARRLHVAPVPVAAALRNRNERGPLRPRPVEAVAAEAQANVVRLLAMQRLSPVHREQPQHHALVRHRVEVVDFRRGLQVLPHHVQGVGADPGHRPGLVPLRRPELSCFEIPAEPLLAVRFVRAQAEDPDAAKRIPEKRAAVARRPRGPGRPPVNAVARQPELQRAGVVIEPRHLEPLRRRGRLQVEPDRVRVPALGRHDVAAGDDVERGAFPRQAIARDGQRGVLLVAAHVPHLEQPVRGIEKHAVAVDHRRRAGRSAGCHRVGIAALPVANRREHGIARVIVGLVKRPVERRLLDEKVVHEQLAADVDADHGGGRRQVRRALGRC